MTSCDKPVKRKFGNNGACYKALDLVKISKVSRRWEGTGGREDCRGRKNSRCKGPQWKDALCGGKTEAGPHIPCSETKHTPHEYSGRDECEGAKCPHKATCTHETVLGSLQNAEIQPCQTECMVQAMGAWEVLLDSLFVF